MTDVSDNFFGAPIKRTALVGVIWIDPESDYVTVREEIKGKRGDLGAIKLETGIIVKGRVLEADGKKCPYMEVSATMQGDRSNPDSIDFPSVVQRRTKTKRRVILSSHPCRRDRSL